MTDQKLQLEQLRKERMAALKLADGWIKKKIPSYYESNYNAEQKYFSGISKRYCGRKLRAIFKEKT